jgi:beta propeller repeat protein
MNRKCFSAFSLLALGACQDVADPSQAGFLTTPEFAVVSGTPTRITNNPYSQTIPAVSGDRIVWADGRIQMGAGFDIFAHEPSSGVGPLVVDASNKNDIQISGDKVVFIRVGLFPQRTVFIHDIPSQVTNPLTDSFFLRFDAGVSGNYVVWKETIGRVSRIILHDLTLGQSTPITPPGSNPFDPVIDGDWVVWRDSRGGQADIYAYNIVTKAETRVTDSPELEQNLNVQGGRVVWDQRLVNNFDVFMADIETRVVRRITTDALTQSGPDISGDYVVYRDGNAFASDIRIFQLSTGVDAPITDDGGRHFSPVIDGNRVVWVSSIAGNNEIFAVNIAVETGDIIDVIDDALADGSIDNKGIGNALTKKLENAQAAIDNGDFVTAATLLNDFINQVSAQSGKHIDTETADELIQLAQALLATLP